MSVKPVCLAAAAVFAAAVAVTALQTLPPEAWWGQGAVRAGLGHAARLALATFFFLWAWALGDACLAGLSRLERFVETMRAKQNNLASSGEADAADKAKNTDKPQPRTVRSPWRPEGGSRLAPPLVLPRLAVGVGTTLLLLFAMAAWGLWTQTAFRGLFAVQAVLILWRCCRAEGPAHRKTTLLRRWMRDFVPLRARALPAWIGLALVLAYLLPSLAAALAPPIGWDDQVYHLSLPRDYLRAGGFFAMPWNFFAQQPGAVDLLFGWGMALGDPMTAVLLHFGLGIGVGIGLWEVARRMGFGRGVAWIAPALFYGHFMVGEEMGWAYNDVGMALFLLAAWWNLTQWARGRAGRYGWLAAGLAGGALSGSKYTGSVLLALVGLCVVATQWAAKRNSTTTRPPPDRSERPTPTRPPTPTEDTRFASGPDRAPLRSPGIGVLLAGMIGFGMVGVVHLLPWGVKNFCFTDNPVWPLLYTRLGGRAWSEELSLLLVAWLRGDYGSGRAPLDWLLLLPRLFFLSDYTPERFAGALSGWPFALALGGLLLAGSAARRRVGGALACFAACAIVWGMGSQQSRFLIPALPLLALGALPAVAVVFGPARWNWRRTTLLGVLAAALFANLYATALPRWKAQRPSAAFLRGREHRGDFLAARVRSYESFRFVEGIPEEDRGAYVLFLFEPMGFYAGFPHRFDVLQASPTLETALEAGDARTFALHLRARGVRWVLVNHNILDIFLGLLDDPPAFEAFRGRPDLLERYRAALRIANRFLTEEAIEVHRAHNTAVYRIGP